MSDNSNKRIAKNSLVLYLRMLISIAVNLYSVRLLWRILGVDNYGIYNVVGGIILMFAFLNNAMVASSQRYISFELGKGNLERLRTTFSVSVTVHFLLAAIILILAESVGLWFLNEKMNIPDGRMVAANWVYQCSVFTFILNVVSVPFNACIVAHEHINIYGYFGILDVVLKLGIILLLMVIPFDPLICYSVLLLILALVMRLIYSIYCRRHFAECRFRKFKDRSLMREMFGFAGWSFLGNMGVAIRDQGMNILLNLFFNVAVNAAKGISNQIGSVINGFASNFTMAVNPQLTKRYASGDFNSMLNLLYRGCKYSLLLMSLIVIPVFVAADGILNIWLDNVAPYTVGFLRLILFMSWVDCVASPIVTSIQATGNIKRFQIVISVIMILNLPLSWLWLKLGGEPYTVMYVAVFSSIIGIIARLLLLREQISVSIRKFMKIVYSRTIPAIAISWALAFLIYHWFDKSIIGIALFGISTVVIYVLISFIVALDRQEHHFVFSAIKKGFEK